MHRLVDIAVIGIILWLKVGGWSEGVIRSEIIVLELTGVLKTIIRVKILGRIVVWSAITVFASIPRVIFFLALK